MNEKFKDIATKAQLEHCVSHVRLQEFGELIVQECANELLKWNREPFPLDAESAARIIKTHFGMK